MRKRIQLLYLHIEECFKDLTVEPRLTILSPRLAILSVWPVRRSRANVLLAVDHMDFGNIYGI